MVLDAIDAFNAGERATKPEKPAEPACPGHTIHVALVVPDIRLYQLVKSKFHVVQPPYDNVRVQLHVLVEDKRDPLSEMPWDIRVALVQSGLVDARDANIHPPDQVTLGWPTEEAQ